MEMTGDGTEAVAESVTPDPEMGWGVGTPLPAGVDGNGAT